MARDWKVIRVGLVGMWWEGRSVRVKMARNDKGLVWTRGVKTPWL